MLKPAVVAALFALAATPSLAGPIIDFSGYRWMVRDYAGGPGPNEWSADNVRLEPDGLHLTIAQSPEGIWHCAEVLMTAPLGFGTYSFEVEGDVDGLDPNIVLGLFNYPGSAEIGPDGTNEIDIEFARWGNPARPAPLNWTVYPAGLGPEPGHSDARFEPKSTVTTHRFVWSRRSVAYSSFDAKASSPDKPVAQWTYEPADPITQIPQQPLVVHLNFWLLDGKPPASGKPAEIVIKSFLFMPE